MTSREKLNAALNHEGASKLAFDLGATKATGISASKLYRLRKLFGRDEPVKVYDTFQMLGLIDEQDAEMFGIDVMGVWNNYTCFGYRNNNWKPWKIPVDGTPALIGSESSLTYSTDGGIYMHPKGDINAAPSGYMPVGGLYFDFVVRQGEYDEDNMDAIKDWQEQLDFMRMTDETIEHIAEHVNHLYNNTDKGIVVNAECCSIGSHTMVFGPCAKATPGIRDYSEFLMAHHLYPEYLHECFAAWTNVAIDNLKKLYGVAGNKPQAVFISSTDFGTQNGLLLSPQIFRDFYVPHFKKVNGWIHQNTKWKTLYHCCGSIFDIIEDFIECGADCLNPIQISASNMEPKKIKEKAEGRLVVWGGCVDCQTTISFGSLADVEKELRSGIELFGKNGGLICSIIHNIQSDVPDENIIRIFDVLKEYR